MFDLRKVPVARILIPFAGGALAGNEMLVRVHLYAICIASFLILIILSFVYLRSKESSSKMNFIFGSLVFILYLMIGIGTGTLVIPKNPGMPVEELVLVHGEVSEDPYQGKKNWVIGFCLDMVIAKDSTYCTKTNLNVYMEMPEDSILPKAGETWKFFGQLYPIKNSGNPGEPDYEAIMNRKNCWYRFFAAPLHSAPGRVNHPTDHRIRSTRIRSTRIRKSISESWSGNPEAIALLKAVCLGDRSGLTDDTRQAYATAGGMHLLAVSGLHIGLIWWVLNHALGWMVRLFGKELYRGFTIIALLWFYAFITGFSSSVSRSVTMFTFFALARTIDQRSQPVNGILVSAFILILINPAKILDVGFQLSYAAILGISFLYPSLRSLLKVKNKILKWIWEATTVSFAAQIATAPLVVYYFHQLPTYSLVTNLFAIPLLSCLIGVFVLSVPFMATGILTGFYNGILCLLANMMNRTMEFIASIPGALIEDLYLNPISFILWCAFVFLLILRLGNRSVFSQYGLLFMVSVWLSWTSWTIRNQLQTAEMVISHFRGGTLLTFREGQHVDHYHWFRDSSAAIYMDRYKAAVWNTRMFESRSFISTESTNVLGGISACQQVCWGLWTLGNDRINGWVIADWISEEALDLVIDHPGDFILLSSEPQLNKVFGLIDASPCDLIVDGSNRDWFVGQLDQCQGIIHFTIYQGAYLKRW